MIRNGRLALLKKIITLTLTLFELPFNLRPFSWEGVSCKGLRQINQRKAFVSLSSHSQELCESRPEDGGDRFFCDTFMRSEEKKHTHTHSYTKQNKKLCQTVSIHRCQESRQFLGSFILTVLHYLTCSFFIFMGSKATREEPAIK